MAVRVAVTQERHADETRVAATPETVKKLIASGCEVAIESGAGLASAYPDADYEAAGASLAPGTYPVTLQATRNGTSATVTLPVTVTPASAPASTWVRKVEWGQTILSENLKLVPGKPALLRVHLLADRPQVPAPAVVATILNALGSTLDTVTLRGPAMVPMAVDEGDLSATYNATLPAADLVHGMKVLLSTGDTVSPQVETAGFVFDLKLVPIIHKGLVPGLPADADVKAGLLAHWPLKDVTISHRAAYTTATVVPMPLAAANAANDHSMDGWAELITEMAELRAVDGSASSYFGYFNADLSTLQSGISAEVGLHYVGYGVGLAIDTNTANVFGGYQTCLDATVHELGHGFDLNHAPAGGAGSPQLDYPYANGSIGTYGYDPATGTLYAPATTQDIMGYQPPYWVSDWNYDLAQKFVESLGSFPNPAAADQAASDQHVVTGWFGPDGQAHLSPLTRAVCRPIAPAPGALELALVSASGTRKVAFGATPVGCLPKGYRAFTFTVPAGADLDAVELRAGGSLLFSRRPRAALAAGGAPRMEERNGYLHVTWDPAVHPFLSVVHEGAARTSLALRLQGGTADLPLEGLPSGGRFVLQAGDGLRSRTFARER